MLFALFFLFYTIFLGKWSHFTNKICIFACSSGRNPDYDALLIDTHLTELA